MAVGESPMPKMKPEIFVPVLTLAIGAVVGFLEASSHHVDDEASFAGFWLGAGLVISLVAWVPALVIGGIWNAFARRISS
jgi:hypothetical protein